MTSDEDFVRAALHQAEMAASEGEVPVGAVIVRDGKVISSGRNNREASQRPDGHAEINAIHQSGQRYLSDCTMYVTLEPCPMCAGMIVASRLKRLVFGAWDPKSGACGSLYNIADDPRLNHSVDVVRGVLADECGQLLTDFFAERRAEAGL